MMDNPLVKELQSVGLVKRIALPVLPTIRALSVVLAMGFLMVTVLNVNLVTTRWKPTPGVSHVATGNSQAVRPQLVRTAMRTVRRAVSRKITAFNANQGSD
jgi:hypothetical protein